MQHFYSAGLLEQFHAEMTGAAGGNRRIVQLSGTCLCIRNEFAHRTHRQLRRCDQHLWRRDHLRHGREVFERVIRQLRHQQRQGNELARRAKQQRVAIGRRARDELGSDDATAACAVVDDHLLANRFLQFTCDCASNEIGRPTRRIGNDQPQRLGRVFDGCSNTDFCDTHDREANRDSVH